MLRFRVVGQWTSFNERYGIDTPGRPDGALEPLGIDFSLDTIGVRQFPRLDSLQSGVQLLTGIPTWNATLGNTLVKLHDRVNAFPLVLELGLTSRLSIDIQVPYLETSSAAFFNVNTAGTNGNLGFNPALGLPAAVTQNQTMVSQFNAAANALEGQLAACQANPAGSPSCPALLANQASAQSLIASSRIFANGVDRIYSTSPFVPIAGTDAQLAIEARVAAFRALYDQFGVSDIAATTTGPFPSQNRLTLPDAQRILTDTAFGIAADPLQSVNRSHLGDIDVGGKLSLFDSFGRSTASRMSPQGFNLRIAVGGIYRIPTAQVESPDNFIDIGTGRGASAIEGRVFTDILLGSRFWQSFVVRYNKPFSDEQAVRILDLPNEELAPLYRRQTVSRTLGSTLEFETAPRFVINDFLALSGWYMYRKKQEDHYTGTFTIPAAITGFGDVTLDASTLDLETAQTEHRFGGGIAFSNLYSYQQGQAAIPFEVSFLHWQTTKGSGGNQPKFFSDQIQLRLYARIFGN